MAIKTFTALEYMTHTNYNTYCQNNGLKWLDTQTTSFGASLLTSNVFTTEFDSYRIVIDEFKPGAGTDTLLMCMRTSGGRYTAGNYYWTYNGVVWSSAAAIGNMGFATTKFEITSGGNARHHGATIEINNIRTSGKPSIYWQATDTVNNCNRIGSGFIYNTADYVGVDIFTNSGSVMICNMSVYGYRKA